MTGIDIITIERNRQIGVEGYSIEHDDSEKTGALSTAAALYALIDDNREHMLQYWPWDYKYLKPDMTHTIDGRIKELSKVGALIAAEIDKLLREKENKL